MKILLLLVIATLLCGSGSLQRVEARSIQASAQTLPVGNLVKAIKDGFGNLQFRDFCSGLERLLSTFSVFGSLHADNGEIIFEAEQDLDLFQVFPVPGGSQFSTSTVLLDTISYECDSTKLSIAAHQDGTQTIIPSVMSVSKAELSVTVNTNDLSDVNVVFNADWSIAGAHIHIEATYEDSTTTVTGTLPESGSVDFVRLIYDLTDGDVSRLLGDSLIISDLIAQGIIDESGDAIFTISATSGNAKGYVIFQVPSEGEAQFAVAIEAADIHLAAVVREITRGKADISSVPYFGSATIPGVGVSYSSADIEGIPEYLFANSPLLSVNGDTLARGVTAYVLFSFSDEPIAVTVEAKAITFTPPSSAVSVRGFMNSIPGININNIPLPPGARDIFSLNVADFEIDLEINTVDVTVVYPGTFKYFDGLLSIRDVMVVVVLEGQDVSLEFLGKVDIGGMTMLAGVEQNADDKYQFFATGERLPLSGIASQLHAMALPDELSFLTDSLPSISIRDPTLTYVLDSNPQQVQIGGTPVIAGFSTIQMNAVIIRQPAQTLLVQGYEIGSINLISFLNKLTGRNFDNWAILNQDVQAALLISPMTLPNVELMGETLSTFDVRKGVSLQATMSLPPNCRSDAFCAVVQTFLGEDVSLSLQGAYESPDSISLVAGVDNINLGSGVVLSETGLELRVSKGTTSAGVVGVIDLSNPDITLAGRIFLGLSGVTLEMSLTGCWNNAFGADFLDICNILGAVSLVPGVPSPLTGIQVGGMVRLGYDTCGSQIVGSGYIGLDVVNPTNNYYYVNIENEVTMQSLMRSFCIDFNVPRPLAESGFPRGFMSSFSLLGVDLPQVSLSIPQGFRYSGTVNILGLEATTNITISLPQGLEYAVELPPLNVGNGLLTMTASRNDRSRGPFMRIDLDLLPTPNVDIEASGYLNVLGISVDTRLVITNEKFEFSIEGRMLNLFEASLLVSASYGNIAQSHFRVRGSFTNNLYSTIERKIREVIQASVDEATGAISGAQRDVDRARGSFDDAQRELRNAQNEVNSAKGAFDSANGELRKARDKVNGVCSKRSCGSSCVGCPRGWTCCGRAWGKCVCSRPKWDGCCTRITDPTCLAANTACDALRETAKAALRAAEGVVSGAKGTLDVANVALDGARVIVRESEVALDAANGVLEAAKQTYRLGAKAGELVASFGVNGLVSITQISFDVELGAAAGGRFAGSVTARFLGGAQTTISLSIDLRDIASMASQLADHVSSGLSGLF